MHYYRPFTFNNFPTYILGIPLGIQEIVTYGTGHNWTPMFFKKNISVTIKNIKINNSKVIGRNSHPLLFTINTLCIIFHYFPQYLSNFPRFSDSKQKICQQIRDDNIDNIFYCLIVVFYRHYRMKCQYYPYVYKEE